jgi:hypothetical protein
MLERDATARRLASLPQPDGRFFRNCTVAKRGWRSQVRRQQYLTTTYMDLTTTYIAFLVAAERLVHVELRSADPGPGRTGGQPMRSFPASRLEQAMP